MSTVVTPPALQNVRGPFLWLSGGFSYGDSPVPFYAVSLRVEDAVNYIHLPNELPLSQERPIDLEELFQRELNQKRVREELVKYLRNTSDPKFFNSLTVALLPMDRVSSHLELAPHYSATPRTNHPTIANYERIDVGQVSLYRIASDPGHGYIAWEPEFTHPVVLDGQHRLAALKMALAEPAFPGKADLANSRISCLMLVLDPRAGFSPETEMSVLSACRAVFTDLNKHARSVSRARQYLLDEHDVAAAALRSVLAPNVEAKPSSTINERVRSTHKLPLAVVDWRSETAKFDGDSPYLTTVLALHGVVEAVLALKSPESDDYEKLGVYLQRLTSKLLEADAASTMLDKLAERLKYAQEREIPFVIPRNIVRELAEGFDDRYGARLTRPLVELSPYRELVEAYETHQLWSSSMEAWFSLEPAGKKLLVEEQEVPDPASQIKEIALNSKSGNLAFQVVFQRALLLGLHSMITFRREVWRDGFDKDDSALSEDSFIDEYISRFDARLSGALSRGASVDSPFVGAGLRPEGVIDFRKTRIGAITGFMVHALVAPTFTGSTETEIRAWLESAWALQGSGAPPYEQFLWTHASAWRRGLADVLRAREEEDSEEAVISLAVKNLSRLR